MKLLPLGLILLTLTSCGGGAESSGGSSATKTIIQPPQVKCGSNDCLTGQAVSFTSSLSNGSQVMALGAGDTFSDFNDEYGQLKNALSRIQVEIQNFNRLATEEELESCEDIPASGSFSVPGEKVTVLSFDVGTEAFDLGTGMVSMQRKISVTTDDLPLMELQVACSGTTQTVHILSSGVNDNMGTPEKVLFEAYYQTDSANGQTNLQFVEVFGTSYRTMGSFKTNGGIDFDVDGFVKYGTGGTAFYRSFSSVGFNDVVFPVGALEMVYSTTSGVNLDAIGFGSVAGQERVCVYGFNSSPVFDDTSSCYANATKSALLPGPILLGQNGSPAWNTTYLGAIDIYDINP